MDNGHRKYADRRVNQYGDPVDIHGISMSAYKPNKYMHFNSMSDILDGSMMTNDDDDDLSTTTSGSYTVDDLDDNSLYPECVVWLKKKIVIQICVQIIPWCIENYIAYCKIHGYVNHDVHCAILSLYSVPLIIWLRKLWKEIWKCKHKYRWKLGNYDMMNISYFW